MLGNVGIHVYLDLLELSHQILLADTVKEVTLGMDIVMDLE